MTDDKSFTIINSQSGNLAFKIFEFSDNSHFDHLQHNNFYSLIWMKKGKGLLKADFSEYVFDESTLFAFAPYQPFMFSVTGKISGVCLQFHSDFYCIHRNPKETNCDTTLFNNIYQKPFLSISNDIAASLASSIESIEAEANNKSDNNYELLIPHLKIILVTLSRLKASESQITQTFTENNIPYLLTQLKTEIENNYKTKHSASDYANLLNISSNALAKIAKTHFNKTLTDLITERIIIEAKRQLYMTSKPIKEIAWLLGYADEFYFSRVFKNHTDISPQLYRDTVGFAKAEMN